MIHPLLDADIKHAIDTAAASYLGRRWSARSFTNLNDRASHPCGVFVGQPFSVFAKLGVGADAEEPFRRELAGLRLVRELAGVATPTLIGSGVVTVGQGCLLLLEALPERPPEARTRKDWKAIGRTLANLHQVNGGSFGLTNFDGFFGPLRQDNRSVPSDRWEDFYAERRLRPRLRGAVDAGHLPTDVARKTERLIERLPDFCGSAPRPTLLHGDAQQHNFVSTDADAVVIDVAPYFGHPEIDLALVDYFDPVADDLFAAYQDIEPIDPGFAERRELWRLFAYLAVVTVDGDKPFGRRILRRLVDALSFYVGA